jgi:hypothetical protein
MKNVVSEMLRHVTLVRTDVSEERSASFMRVKRIGKLRVTLVVTSNQRSLLYLLVTAKVPSSSILVTLIMEALRSSETSVLTRAARRNIPEDDILHSQSQRWKPQISHNSFMLPTLDFCTETSQFPRFHDLTEVGLQLQQ